MMRFLDKIRPLFAAINLLSWLALAIPLLGRGLMMGFAHLNKCVLDGKPCWIGGEDRSDILMLPWRPDIHQYSSVSIAWAAVGIVICFIFKIIDRRAGSADVDRILEKYER